jgi:hypothetical protein
LHPRKSITVKDTVSDENVPDENVPDEKGVTFQRILLVLSKGSR